MLRSEYEVKNSRSVEWTRYTPHTVRALTRSKCHSIRGGDTPHSSLTRVGDTVQPQRTTTTTTDYQSTVGYGT